MRRSVGEWCITEYTPTLYMVFVGSATLTDCVDRPYDGLWCGVVSCRQPHLFRRSSGRPIRGGVGRGGVAIAFRLRLSSSASLEQRGVTLGVVVGVEGAMVSRLLLLIIV
eukprot:scaffold44525_cov53-Attheya_sp.AAC.1